MYSQQWDNSYASTKQVTYNGDTYQTSYSYSYSVSGYSYTCTKNSFGCPNPGACFTYQNCANSDKSDCYCGTDVANAPFCFQDGSCESPTCSKNSDCQAGYACLNANSCCGFSVCLPATFCQNKNSRRFIFAKREKDIAAAQKRDGGSGCSAASCPNPPASS